MSVETELKFAVNPQDVARISHALAATSEPPRRSTLVTTYYDTADRSLKKGKMTLRVRRRGRRFVQTVKSDDLSADLAARSEWEDTIRQQTPDLTAAQSGERVHQAVGTSDLRAVFTTTVRRSVLVLKPSPTTVIEAAFDEGEIRSADETLFEPVCELELELKGGERAALYDIALRLLEIAPLRMEVRSKAERGYAMVAKQKTPAIVRAPPIKFGHAAPVETVLQRVGRACLWHAVRNEPAASAGAAEGVHQIRVAIRRLRSALAAVKPMLSPEHYRWTSGEAKSLLTALGAPRNWDVIADELLPPLVEVVPEQREDLDRLSRAVGRQRRIAYDKAEKGISSSETTATILRLSRWFEACAWRDQPVSPQSAQLMSPIGDLAPKLLARRFRQAKKRSKKFKSLSPLDRHRLRIALKKLRYTIELLACLFNKKQVEGYLDALKALQDGLGYVSDVRTAHAMFGELGDSAKDPVICRMSGVVLGWHVRTLADQEKSLRAHVRVFRRAQPFWR